jgi:elongator complex protein 1
LTSARPGKINTACTAIRASLSTLDADRYLHCVLTTYVKQEPPALEDALQRVLNVKMGDIDNADNVDKEGQDKQAKVRSDRARAALKYLLLLVDVKQLYNAALASYNLEFALLVAQVGYSCSHNCCCCHAST